jgi:hypothetical protein
MAKVTGPLMSLDASGTVGHTAVFSKWKGRNYVRVRVIPRNMRTGDQQLVRGFLGVIAKAARAVLTAAKDVTNGLGSQFWADTQTHVPASQSWVAAFQGSENRDVATDKTHFATLTGVKDDYEDAAATAGLVPYVSVGDTPITYSPGFQLYILAKYAVSALACDLFVTGGIDLATSGELVNFVDYIQVGLTP